MLIAGNFIYLWTNYKVGLQTTFSGEAIKSDSQFQKLVEDTVKNIQAKASTLPPDSFSSEDVEKNTATFEKLFNDVKSDDIFRIKVWNKNYTVIWSNATELIGKKFPDNHEVQEALEGEIEVEPKSGKPENYSERAFSNFAEIYVPIKDKSGKIVGVVETYKVTEDIVTRLRSDFYKGAALSLGISAVILIFAVFGIKLLVH